MSGTQQSHMCSHYCIGCHTYGTFPSLQKGLLDNSDLDNLVSLYHLGVFFFLFLGMPCHISLNDGHCIWKNCISSWFYLPSERAYLVLWQEARVGGRVGQITLMWSTTELPWIICVVIFIKTNIQLICPQSCGHSPPRVLTERLWVFIRAPSFCWVICSYFYFLGTVRPL